MVQRCDKTLELFGDRPRRGRPRTSSREKRRADNARRQRRYRARQRLINRAVVLVACQSPPAPAAVEFLRYAYDPKAALGFRQTWVRINSKQGVQKVFLSFSEIKQKLLNGEALEFD